MKTKTLHTSFLNRRFILPILAVLSLLFAFSPAARASNTVITITNLGATALSTSWTCPVGVSSVQVEMWGGGGSGGSAGGSVANAAGSGGGGGAYTISTVSVSAGSYSISVGNGGQGANNGVNNGASTTFPGATTATGGTAGAKGISNTAVSGGAGASGFSGSNHNGGNGAASAYVASPLSVSSGAGGNSGTPSADGTSASSAVTVAAITAPTAQTGGGQGAAGITRTTTGLVGNPGSFPGGGGGGAARITAVANAAGGNGGGGQIKLTYTTPVYYGTGGNAASLANWNTVQGGGGSTPTSFTLGGVFYIPNGVTMTLSGTTWTLGTQSGSTPGESPIVSGVEVASGGQLTCDASSTVAGAVNFTVDSGGTLSVASSTGIAGNIIVTGTKTFTAGSSYIYAGSSAITGDANLPATVNNLTISDAAGFTLNQNTTVNGTLTLTSGTLISTASKLLTLGSAATVSGGSSSSYVVGPLAQVYGATGSKAFPVGYTNSSDYHPITVNITTISGTPTITVTPNEPSAWVVGNTPANTTMFATRDWTVNSSGAGNTATFTVDGTGWSPVGSAQNLEVYNGSTTTYATTFSSPNYTTTTGVSLASGNNEVALGDYSNNAQLGSTVLSTFGNVQVNRVSVTNQYTLTGSSLNGSSVTVSPPANFEVSLDQSSWTANPSALTVPYTGGTLSSNVYVRFKPTALTSYSGNIVNAGGGANSVNTAVSGTGALPAEATLSAAPSLPSTINLTIGLNSAGNNVVVVYNTTGTFTTPSGAPTAVGTSFAGGTILQNSTSTSYSHTSLAPGQYFYKAWSYDSNGNFYSPAGVSANATLTATLYSQGSGDPAVAANWNTARNGSGSTPVNIVSGELFVIQSGHTMTTTAPWTVSGTGAITIENGGTLTVSGGVLTVNHTTGTAPDLDVHGTLNLSYSGGNALTFGTGGLMTLESDGVLNHSGAVAQVSGGTLTFNGSYYQNIDGGVVPTATWATTSTCEIDGMVSAVPTGLNQTLGKLVWNCTGQAANVIITNGATIAGNLRVQSTGVPASGYYLQFANSVTISGNLQVDAGVTYNSPPSTGNKTLTVTGNTTVSGTFNIIGPNGSKTFNGTFTINNGGSVTTAGNAALGVFVWNGDFVINSGGSMNVTASPFPSFYGNLAITNPAVLNLGLQTNHLGGTGKTISGVFTIGGSVSIDGTYQNNATLTMSATFSGTGTLTQGATGILNLSAGTAISGPTLDATATGNTVNYTGAAQTVYPTTYANLTLSGSAAKTLGGITTVNGTLTRGGSTASLSLGGGAPNTNLTYGASATLKYAGTAAQTMASTEFPGTVGAPPNVEIANTFGVKINTTKTISGTLTVDANTTLDFNSLAMTVGGTSLSSSGALIMEVTKSGSFSGSKLTQTSGTLTYAGSLTNTLTGSLVSGDAIPLFSAPAYGGGFSSITAPAAPTGLTVNTSQLTGGTGGNITYTCDGTFTISTTSLPNGTYGSAYNQTVTTATAATSFSATGLPPGLSINNSGVISGTPTVAGTSNVTINAGNAVGCTASTTISLTINPASTSVGASSSENPSGYKDTVSFNATLPADATGSVVFSSTNGPISTNTLSSGTATSLSITNLPRGTNVITVAYLGDGNYVGSTNTLNQIVTNHPPVAVDATYYRAKGLSLKIAITNLLANVTDVDGDTNTLQSVGAGLTNATIMTDSTYVYYLPGTGVGSNDNDVVSYTVSDGFGGTATANILVNVYSAAGPAQMSLPTNGVVNITFFGIPNYTYVVQTTTNLSVPWWTLSTNTASTNGSWQFTDPNATNAQQYYRSAQP